METLFEELKRYVQWGEEDERALRALHPVAVPELERIAGVFYQRILDHAEARKALQGGESSVGRLKLTLQSWMDTLLSGPWDESYYQMRARIGRVHVRIALPQHYMFGAMDVLRQELVSVIDRHFDEGRYSSPVARRALGKILDLELAIMLHTFREDLLAQQQAMQQVEHNEEKRVLARRAQVAEKLAAVGTLMAGLSHEIKNPLNAVGLRLVVLDRRIRKLERDDQERLREPVLLVQDEVARLNRIMEDFLAFARPLELRLTNVDLSALLGRVADLLAAQADAAGVRLERAWAGVPAITGDADRVQQAIFNLLLNAIQAAGQDGFVRITAERSEDGVRIVVEDSGAGISVEHRNRVFEPFFTTKEGGSGLGLPFVYSVVQQHGGSIAIETGGGGGARFVVVLPVGVPHDGAMLAHEEEA